MPRAKDFEPKYRLHRSSGQAYVTIEGKDVWLGKHGTPESRNKYHAALAEWVARDRHGPPPAPVVVPTVSIVLAAFLKHADAYFRRPDGSETADRWHFRQAMKIIRELYGATPAAEFGPLKLQAVRAAMIRRGWSRTYVNHQVGRVRALFKWAVENEHVPPAVHHGLVTVRGLRRGKSEARETAPSAPSPTPASTRCCRSSPRRSRR